MSLAKKSVTLSGIIAGNTAICTVGQSGNDLHYRGYDIADLARGASFEEVAHLLIHGHLPNAAELAVYRARGAGSGVVSELMANFGYPFGL